ncbi:MAG: DUF4040 domain-containing protein [Phycisphaeraceae bacterium]|nr:DUF4040 domain-containing protein [Phycisphaeraceae bacterium]
MTDMTQLLPWIVLTPFAGAALLLLVGRWLAGRSGLVMAATAVASFSMAAWMFASTQGSLAPFLNWAWMPELNIAFALHGDPFGLFFTLLVSGIGLLISIYSMAYVTPMEPGRMGRYYATLTAFMAAMIGIALADDLMLLFVFWEITSITSFLLIGYWYEQEGAKKGALTALQVTALGGLVMMVGFILIGQVAGTFSLHVLYTEPQRLEALTHSPLFTAAMVLVLLGAMTKSAQFPFQFWLPGAMVAPTPVSAYLHAATMVKAGIFLMGRMLPVFGENPWWSPILISIGLLTFFLGAYQAFLQTDLKAILARTTVSTLGLITLIYGLHEAGQDALQILNHAAYKGSLFLVAGIVEHATHTRDLRKLGGLRKAMPITFILCLLAAISMSGLPPFFGYLAKETLYDGLLTNEILSQWPAVQKFTIAVSVLTNAFVFAVGLKLVFGIFLGRKPDDLEHVHDATPGLWIPTGVLAAMTLILGLLPGVTSGLVSGFSSEEHTHLHLALIPHHAGPAILSLVTITLGVILYNLQNIIERAHKLIALLPTAQSVWDKLLGATNSLATAYSSRWQSGSLSWYLSGCLAFLVGLVVLALWRGGVNPEHIRTSLSEMPWYGLVLCVLLSIASIAIVRARTRLEAAILSTAIGFTVSTLFVVYRSPDILLTQILIETVSTIFVLLILIFMPAFKKRDPISTLRKGWHLAVSIAVGGVVTLLLLLSMSPQFRETANLGAGYLQRSPAQGGGANAVNVIIVDIRATDTNGEITVLVVVGLCVYGLLRARRPHDRSEMHRADS